MSRYTDLPQVQALGDGGPRSQTQMAVIHATDNTAPASGEASYATHRADQTSAHFYVDDTSVWQALDTTHEAYGCYPIGNSRSVQVELCGLSDHLSDATMRRAASIVARACREFGIPIRKVSAADLRAGVRGICGHADVTAAWGQGDHTDPGATFPWATFIDYVRGEDMALSDVVPNTGGRDLGTVISDLWNFEAKGKSGFDGSKLERQQQLDRIEADVKTPPAVSGAPTQDQVDQAVAKALADPNIQDGIAARIAAHVQIKAV